MSTKLVILASGRGTDFQAIVDHITMGILKGVTIEGLICNHEGAQVKVRAEDAGISCRLIPGIKGRNFASRNEREDARVIFDAACIDAIKKLGANLVVLAGFDQILSSFFVESFDLQILNIHPAYDVKRFGGREMIGRKVHELVLKSGIGYSGCAIHYVTNDVDGGPVILKKKVEISEVDTPDSLERKILKQEHLAYPEAIQLVADRRVKIDNKEKRCYVDRFSDGWDIDWDARQQKYIASGRNET